MLHPWRTCAECGARYQQGPEWSLQTLCSPRCRSVRRHKMQERTKLLPPEDEDFD